VRCDVKFSQDLTNKDESKYIRRKNYKTSWESHLSFLAVPGHIKETIKGHSKQNSHRFIRYRLQHLDQWDKHTVIFDLQINL